MDKYYYFVSQLPSLVFDQEPQVDQSYFLGEAKKWVGEKEYKIISKIRFEDFNQSKDDPGALADYKSFEAKLRHEIFFWRKANREGTSHHPQSNLNLSIDQGSPLANEKQLLLLRWQFLEDKESEHNFDLAYLIVYFLKLQILARLFVFDKEKGTKRFDELCEVKP